MVTTRRSQRKKGEETGKSNETLNREPIQSEEESEESDDNAKKEESLDENDEGREEDSDNDGVQISDEEIHQAIALATDGTTKKFGWSQETNVHGLRLSNPLSEVIPGYVAPMALDSSSLNKYKNPKRLLACTSATITPAIEISNKPTFMSKNFKMSKPDPANLAKNSKNAGSGWFNFEATPASSSLQADIAVIRNRNYIDPKKFYKASDFNKKGSQMVQLGTVIEGSMESVYSNRLSKRQRKENVLEEVMGDVFGTKDDYVKKKFTKMQTEKSLAGRKRTKREQKGKGNLRR